MEWKLNFKVEKTKVKSQHPNGPLDLWQWLLEDTFLISLIKEPFHDIIRY